MSMCPRVFYCMCMGRHVPVSAVCVCVFACVVIMCAVPLCACDYGFCVFLCVGWLWSGLCFTVCGCVTVSPRASPPTRGSLPVMRIDMLGCGWVSVGVWRGGSLFVCTRLCVCMCTHVYA